MQSKERFRKGFVLVMTIAYSIMFFAMIWGFVEALLMAAVFSGILYPFYLRLSKAFNGRNTPASLVTLLIAILVVVIPLMFLLGMIGDQAVGDYRQGRALGSATDERICQVKKFPCLPGFPMRTGFEPYKVEISAKLGDFLPKAQHLSLVQAWRGQPRARWCFFLTSS